MVTYRLAAYSQHLCLIVLRLRFCKYKTCKRFFPNTALKI